MVVDLDGKGADITSGTVGIAGSRFSVLIVEVQLSVQDRVVSLFLCFVDLVLCAAGICSAVFALYFFVKRASCDELIVVVGPAAGSCTRRRIG